MVCVLFNVLEQEQAQHQGGQGVKSHLANQTVISLVFCFRKIFVLLRGIETFFITLDLNITICPKSTFFLVARATVSYFGLIVAPNFTE